MYFFNAKKNIENFTLLSLSWIFIFFLNAKKRKMALLKARSLVEKIQTLNYPS